VAGLDLIFIPALGVTVGRAVAATRQLRNAIFPALLAVLFAANLLDHLEALDVTQDTAALGLRLALYIFTVMVAVLGSRMIPAFTRNALKQDGIEGEVRSGGKTHAAARQSRFRASWRWARRSFSPPPCAAGRRGVSSASPSCGSCT
jgi:uncharacterized protein involved in response to NO